MKCPKCDDTLSIGERNGVEIDYCVTCRGIWLDAGELDKIIDRSGAFDKTQRDDNESWWERILDLID